MDRSHHKTLQNYISLYGGVFQMLLVCFFQTCCGVFGYRGAVCGPAADNNHLSYQPDEGQEAFVGRGRFG